MKVLTDNTRGLSGKQIRFGVFDVLSWMPKRLQPQAAGDDLTPGPRLINDQ